MYLVRTLMAQDGVWPAGQEANGAGKIGVADARGVDLDENLIGLDGVEVDLLELKLAVELGHNKGGGRAGHGCI